MGTISLYRVAVRSKWVNTCKVLGMVPALSWCYKVYCVHTTFLSFSFQSLSPLVHQYLLLEGLLCARSVLEYSIENYRGGWGELSPFCRGVWPDPHLLRFEARAARFFTWLGICLCGHLTWWLMGLRRPMMPRCVTEHPTFQQLILVSHTVGQRTWVVASGVTVV